MFRCLIASVIFGSSAACTIFFSCKTEAARCNNLDGDSKGILDDSLGWWCLDHSNLADVWRLWYFNDPLSSWSLDDPLSLWHVDDSLSSWYLNDSLSLWYLHGPESSWSFDDSASSLYSASKESRSPSHVSRKKFPRYIWKEPYTFGKNPITFGKSPLYIHMCMVPLHADMNESCGYEWVRQCHIRICM